MHRAMYRSDLSVLPQNGDPACEQLRLAFIRIHLHTDEVMPIWKVFATNCEKMPAGGKRAVDDSRSTRSTPKPSTITNLT